MGIPRRREMVWWPALRIGQGGDVVGLEGNIVGVIRVATREHGDGLVTSGLLQRRDDCAILQSANKTRPDWRYGVAARTETGSAQMHVGLQTCQVPDPLFVLQLFIDIILGRHEVVSLQQVEVFGRRTTGHGWTGGGLFVNMVAVRVRILIVVSGSVRDVLCSRSIGPLAASPSLGKVPMPDDDKDDVDEIVTHHGQALPQLQLAVPQEAQAEDCGNAKEDDIPHVRLPGDLEGLDDAHGAGDAGGDEAGGTKELANGQTAAVAGEGGKGGEDIGAAIAKSQEGDASQTLTHAKYGGNGAQVDAEEVAGGDANGAEEKTEPDDYEDEGGWFCVGESAVVEGEIRVEARVFVGTTFVDVGALVVDRDITNQAALRGGGVKHVGVK